MITPRDRYNADLARPDFVHDPAQEQTVERLQWLYHELINVSEPPFKWTSRLWAKIRGPQVTSIKGLYLWGGVGRGKTYLVDVFYQCLPFERKQRIHFHRFMRAVHIELKSLPRDQDPLATVAARMSQTTRIICLDEFYVSDIGDAMILYGLLKGLFANGVILVATSNTEPDKLYQGGLQRDRFVPAIDLIKAHTAVVKLDGEIDHRLRRLDKANIYRSPLNDETEQNMLTAFAELATSPGTPDVKLEIDGRTIDTRLHTDGMVWIEFERICGDGRSQNDYIELAKCFHTIFVSAIPVLGPEQDDQARRFISLVDELYDRNVNLIVSAQTSPPKLYTGTRLAAAFERTISRLLEMQSMEYLARRHLP
ncbi:MAG: cell division protein ZapE [Gammaproteobacteria bacterium]|nr:cell division protein ZapE [Gammaproteobacteria bacterium]